MNLFDMRTIVISHMITNIVCVWFVLLLWRQNRNRFAGTAFWVVGFVFQAAALFLIALRGPIPDWISIVLSNTLVVVGGILGFMGLERFVGKRGPQVHNYLLVTLFIFIHSYYALVQPNLAVRNLNFSVALLLVCFQSVWLVWRRVGPALRFLAFGVGAVNFLYCLLSSVRIAHFFIAPHVDNNYFQPVLFAAILLVSYQMLFIMLTYSFVLMVNKRLLMEIAIQEEKFSKAFHSAPYAITITRTEDGKFIEINNAFTLITGFSREKALDDSSIEMNLWVNEEDRQMVVGDLRAGLAVVDQEYPFRTKSGKVITGLFSAQTLHLNQEPCILSSINDITERKQAEEEKAELEAQLRQSQKIESLGTLAGGVAHNINNILAVIIGNTELALDDVPESNPASKCLKEILSASLRAKDVVSQILGFAQKSVFHLMRVQISPIISETLKLIRASFPSTIEIRQDLYSPDTILADATQISQALMILCDNAKKAMQEKGGVLEVKLENTLLDEKNASRYENLSPGNYLKLIVRDTGHGIDPKIMDRIFDPYFTTSSLAEAAGMGLAVVHGIVRRHNGAISVASEPGKGSVFEVLFPLTG